ncbi:MAG: hypothetical protein LBB10_03660 [Bifidobacteriaceae bacterium]|jgi:hypothetical protein|nr:hypothetical protein [Bifidobacteriaceae bacterium]
MGLFKALDHLTAERDADKSLKQDNPNLAAIFWTGTIIWIGVFLYSTQDAIIETGSTYDLMKISVCGIIVGIVLLLWESSSRDKR